MKRLLVIALVLLFACNVQAATNYPGSLDSYSTKASSDTIAEGHINDPQDAIEAIEAKVGTGASTPVDTTVLIGTGTGTSAWTVSTPIVQIVNKQITGETTSANVIPDDNTIPQLAEATAVDTLTITPKNASNKLLIRVNAWGTAGNTEPLLLLFDEVSNNCLRMVGLAQASSASKCAGSLTYFMAAGKITEKTFYVRIGTSNANGTWIINNTGTGPYGGVLGSSITITEYSV